MMLSIISFGLLLAGSVAGHTKPLKSCRDYTLPITTTTANFIWGLPELQNNLDAATFSVNLSRWDSNTTFHPIAGGAKATNSYKISGTFCSPGTKGNGVVLLATHGFGFDRGYALLITLSQLTSVIAIGILRYSRRNTALLIMPSAKVTLYFSMTDLVSENHQCPLSPLQICEIYFNLFQSIGICSPS